MQGVEIYHAEGSLFHPGDTVYIATAPQVRTRKGFVRRVPVQFA